MPSADRAGEAAEVWDIACPARRCLPGVTMAGFRARTGSVVELSIVPYPAVTVAVDVAEGLLVVDAAAGRHERDALVVGLAPARAQAQGRDLECLQIRLSPVVAHAVLDGAPAASGAVVSLEELWGRDARRAQERLQAAATWDERFAIASEALGRRQEDGRSVDPEVAYAWRTMVASAGQVRVEAVAAEAGWSRKRLWKRFRAQVGLTPKRAAELIRFDHAAHRLAAGKSPAAVAAEGGYVDQSHLHREVMAFTGLTPTAVAAAAWLTVDPVAWATAVG